MLTDGELNDFLGDYHQRETIVQKIKFPPLQTASGLPQSTLPISFLDDVMVDVWAELGEVSLTVRDILNMKEDTVMELDKPAGETVNLKVNGQSFARGEVIIIGNNLGIRVDRIYDPNREDPAGKDEDKYG